MPKKGKKRRLSGLVTVAADSFYVAGLDDGAVNSIESCLEELEAAVGSRSEDPSISQQSAVRQDNRKVAIRREEEKEDATSTDLLWEPILTEPLPGMDRASRDRSKTWSQSFKQWLTQGSYTPGLLPCFDVELARHFQVKELSSYLLDACSSDLRMPSFERWLIDSKLEEQKHARAANEDSDRASDPILSRSTIYFHSSQRLIQEICETGVPQDEAMKIVKELCRRTIVALQEIVSQSRRYANQTPLKKGDRINLEDHDTVLSLVYSRKKWHKSFCIKINKSHYYKLRAMFQRVHGPAGIIRLSKADQKPTKVDHAFHLLLMVLLLRYSSLSGGQLLNDLRGGGMQGSVHGEMFHVLRDFFPNLPLLECFASPLNAYLASFGSAFPDLDWHFGSVGDFLETTVTAEGCCQANPPFSPGLMDTMVDRMEKNLLFADKKELALSFLVIVPTATNNDASTLPLAKRFALPSFRRMTSCSSCRLHIILSARQHGYIEGAQHMRPTRYKDSNYDTSVLLLQSRHARRRPLDLEQLERKIRSSFISRHSAELDRRRQQDKDVQIVS